MKKRKKKKIQKKIDPENRMKDAEVWLSEESPKDLLTSYSKRYGVSPAISHDELFELGCADDLYIQSFESQGIDWEYRYDANVDEMKVVPKGTPDRDLYLY